MTAPVYPQKDKARRIKRSITIALLKIVPSIPVALLHLQYLLYYYLDAFSRVHEYFGLMSPYYRQITSLLERK